MKEACDHCFYSVFTVIDVIVLFRLAVTYCYDLIELSCNLQLNEE